MDFSNYQIISIILIFIWTGFVRTGLGFGGSALGLPLLLLIENSAVYWLPIIGLHLLFFSAITLSTALKMVDWSYLKYSLLFIIPPTLIGVFGLVNLPDKLISIFIYSITLMYGAMWVFNWNFKANNKFSDKALLIIGGYIAGTSLTGAPLLVAVYMQHVNAKYLRNTLFVLWFILVSIKMTTFVALGVFIDWKSSIMLIPFAAIGHIVGLKLHQQVIKNNQQFKKIIGIFLVIISAFSIINIVQYF